MGFMSKLSTLHLGLKTNIDVQLCKQAQRGIVLEDSNIYTCTKHHYNYMYTNILNLNTDIAQCAKDDEFIRSILVASSRFSFLRPLLVHVNYEALSLLFYLLVSLIALFSVDYLTISQLDNSNFFYQVNDEPAKEETKKVGVRFAPEPEMEDIQTRVEVRMIHVEQCEGCWFI